MRGGRAASFRPTAGAALHPPPLRSPGGTGNVVNAAFGSIWQARDRANFFDSSVFTGTLTYAGSPT